MDLFKKCEDYTVVKDAIKNGYYPYFHALETKQDIVVQMEGRRVIMIGSNNYLGLTSDKRVIEAGIQALNEFGTGCSGSRFLNGTLTIHEELEAELCEFLGKEACTTFGTGFQSNLGIISAIAGRNDYIICDKENHASIYDGCRLSYAKMLRYNHSDMEDLERQLKSVPSDKGILIVTDGVFSMRGDICKLPEIVKLAKKYGARTMVDDAHGLGVLGEHGKGTCEHFGLTDQVDIIMGTFSKSLASIGGYVASTKEVVSYIKHTSRPYIFCASLTPASARCALTSLRILKQEPERVKNLRHISNYVRQGMKARGIEIIDAETPIIPIFTYDFLRTLVVDNLIFKNGVFVNPVIPPAVPNNECLLRTSYTATHTESLMDEAMDIIKKCLVEVDKIDLTQFQK